MGKRSGACPVVNLAAYCKISLMQCAFKLATASRRFKTVHSFIPITFSFSVCSWKSLFKKRYRINSTLAIGSILVMLLSWELESDVHRYIGTYDLQGRCL